MNSNDDLLILLTSHRDGALHLDPLATGMAILYNVVQT